jgi:hypothetical protein
LEHLHLSQHFLKTNLQFKIQRLESWFIGWRNKQLLIKAVRIHRSIFVGRAPLGHVFGYSFFFPLRSNKKAVCLNRSRGYSGSLIVCGKVKRLVVHGKCGKQLQFNLFEPILVRQLQNQPTTMSLDRHSSILLLQRNAVLKVNWELIRLIFN